MKQSPQILPVVSVIIPCFNKGNVVREAVASVQGSTYKNVETIIINDGSTDPYTIRSLEEIGKDTTLRVYTKKNGGLSSARNYGLEKAQGEYIFFLDHDDLIPSEFLEAAVKFMEAHPNVPFGYPEVIFFGERKGLKDPGSFSYSRLRIANYIVASCVHRRDIIKKYPFDESLKVFEDWDLLLRLAENGLNGEKLPSPCYFLYRIAGNSMIGQYNSATKRLKAARHIQQLHAIKLSWSEQFYSRVTNILYPFLRVLVERTEIEAQRRLFQGNHTLSEEVRKLIQK